SVGFDVMADIHTILILLNGKRARNHLRQDTAYAPAVEIVLILEARLKLQDDIVIDPADRYPRIYALLIRFEIHDIDGRIEVQLVVDVYPVRHKDLALLGRHREPARRIERIARIFTLREGAVRVDVQ